MSEITSKKKLSQNPPRRDIEEKEKLAQWISKEITSREYTDKEMKAMIYYSKTGQNKKIWKILLKGHKCLVNCYCDYCQSAKTWQEKINKGNRLIELAEKEINEAEKLRVRKGTELLMKHFNSNK
jgi:glutaredoxin